MKYLFLLCLVITSATGYCQQHKIDSLHGELTKYDARKRESGKNIFPEEMDTTRVKLLYKLSWEYTMISNFPMAKKLAAEGYELAEEINYKPGMAKSLATMGVINSIMGDLQEGLKNHLASLEINKKTGNKNEIARSYNNIGAIYLNQGNYPEALEYYFASLKISEETGDKAGIGTSHNNIGIIYQIQNNYDDALENYHAALKLRQEVGDKNGIAATYGNMGLLNRDKKKYAQALNNFEASLEMFREIGDKSSSARTYVNIGALHNLQQNFESALQQFHTAVKISEEIGDSNILASAYAGIGNTYNLMNRAAEGRPWLNKALDLARESESASLLKDVYENLERSDSLLGNFRGAYENHKLYIRYRDSLDNEEATKKALQARMQFEYDKKHLEARTLSDAELSKQKLVRNGLIAGFAIVLLFAGMVVMQHNKTRKEKHRSDALLLNILPAEIADEIKTAGRASAKAYTMVTVMFTDFKDFTTVTEKVSAELLVAEIHTCFSAFDKILEKYRIEKIKTIGDAYLCASGLPVSSFTHAEDMIRAGMEILAFMEARKNEKQGREIAFDLRVGIHTGPVVAGVVGLKKYAYDIWGDTVNIAARMEQHSEAGKINVSGTTYELVKDKFRFIHRGKIEAKNKGEIDMYFVEYEK